MASQLKIHWARDLDRLVDEARRCLREFDGGVLESPWAIVPSSATRQRWDWDLSAGSERGGGVSANIRYMFPEEFVSEIERLALGAANSEWTNWDLGPMTLRIKTNLGCSYDAARRLATELDERVRWRAQSFDVNDLGDDLERFCRSFEWEVRGPLAQRRRVLDIIRSSGSTFLPSRIFTFGLVNVPGGHAFLELLVSVAEHRRIDVMSPTPSATATRRWLSEPTAQVELASSWTRDARDAVVIWHQALPNIDQWNIYDDTPTTATTLGHLQAMMASGELTDNHLSDASVRVIGAVGVSRQVEQLRDELMSIIESDPSIAPHDILVVSPDLGSFEAALERHWHHDVDSNSPLPRLAFELLERSTSSARNRLSVSLTLLGLIDNYVTTTQLRNFLALPAVAQSAGLDVESVARLFELAERANVNFGVSRRQRQWLEVYSDEVDAIGSWERLSDRVVQSNLQTRPASDSGARVGTPDDLEVLAAIQPLLSLLDANSGLRSSGERRELNDWLGLLARWMHELAGVASENDDSFERTLTRVRRWIDPTASNGFTFDEFQSLWRDTSASRTRPQIFGRRGVHVADTSTLVGAPYRVVCILGLDEQRLPSANLRGTALITREIGDPDPRRTVLGSLLYAVTSAREHLVITYNCRDESDGKSIHPSIALSELLDALSTVSGDLAAGALTEGSRHGFIASGALHPVSFDRRYARAEAWLADARVNTALFVEQSSRIAPLHVPVTETVDINELRRFFRDPITYHLRRVRSLDLPDDLTEDTTHPRVALDGLERYALGRRFVEVLADEMPDGVDDREALLSSDLGVRDRARELLHAWLRDESVAGDIPTSLVEGQFDLDALVLGAVNLRRDRLDFVPLDDENYLPITLADGRQVTLRTSNDRVAGDFEAWRDTSGRAGGAPASWCFESRTMDNGAEWRNLVAYLLDALVLAANARRDERPVVSAFFMPKSTTTALPNPLVALRYEAGPEAAVKDLATLVALFDEGSRRPIPLFRTTTIASALATPELKARERWQSFGGFGDSTNPGAQLLYPVSYGDLRDLSSDGALPYARTLADVLTRSRFARLTARDRKRVGENEVDFTEFTIIPASDRPT